MIRTYAYEFMDRTAPSYMEPASFPYGAAHTSEIQYLFPQYHGSSRSARAAPAECRAATIVRSDGELLDHVCPEWLSEFVQDTKVASYKDGVGDNWQLLQLSAPVTAAKREFASRHNCDFWDAISSEIWVKLHYLVSAASPPVLDS